MAKKKRKAERAAKRILIAGLTSSMVFAGISMQANAAALKDVFSAEYYADANPDLKTKFGYDMDALWNHYLTYGLREGRKMNPLIDLKKYREKYADLDKAFGDDWEAYLNHYLKFGASEGRDSGTGINLLDYAARYPDVRAAFGDDILKLYDHYLTVGMAEGRDARSDEIVAQEAERLAACTGEASAVPSLTLQTPPTTPTPEAPPTPTPETPATPTPETPATPTPEAPATPTPETPATPTPEVPATPTPEAPATPTPETPATPTPDNPDPEILEERDDSDVGYYIRKYIIKGGRKSLISIAYYSADDKITSETRYEDSGKTTRYDYKYTDGQLSSADATLVEWLEGSSVDGVKKVSRSKKLSTTLYGGNTETIVGVINYRNNWQLSGGVSINPVSENYYSVFDQIPSTDWEEREEYGNGYGYTIRKYNAASKIYEEITYNPDGTESGRYEYQYDDAGVVTEFTDFYKGSERFTMTFLTEESGGFTREMISPNGDKIVGKYDVSGREMEEERSYSNGDVSTSRCQYDEKGSCTRTTESSTGGETVEEGDEFGRSVKTTYYYKGEVTLTTENEYDASGGFLKTERQANGEISRTQKYTDRGHMEELTNYSNGVKSNVWEYNSKNKPSKVTNYSSDGEKVTSTEEYEYEESGNYTKTTTLADGTVWVNRYDANNNLLKDEKSNPEPLMEYGIVIPEAGEAADADVLAEDATGTDVEEVEEDADTDAPEEDATGTDVEEVEEDVDADAPEEDVTDTDGEKEEETEDAQDPAEENGSDADGAGAELPGDAGDDE